MHATSVVRQSFKCIQAAEGFALVTCVQEVEIKITSISEQIHLERPFQTVVKLQSHVDRQLGPLTLTTASGQNLLLFLAAPCLCDETAKISLIVT